MRAHEFKSLLEKFSRGECTPQEEKLINEWYENIESETNTESVPEMSEMSPEYRKVIEERIWSKVNPHPPAKKTSTVWYYAAPAAAAVVIGCFFVFNFDSKKELAQKVDELTVSAPVIKDTQEHIVNTTTSIQKVRLADGSTVALQPRSEISYNKKFDGSLREVYLSGEAFFDVSRDEKRPFRVYSEEVVTQVLGTSFTVKAYVGDKEVTVAVRTGKVSVYAKHHNEGAKEASEKPIILAPNQQAVYNRSDDKVVKEVVDNPAILLPESNLFRMSFDEAPVTSIFDVLEENYGIDIVYDKDVLGRCMLTTAMSDEGLFERIEVICKAIKANYKIKDGAILIDSQGCE